MCNKNEQDNLERKTREYWRKSKNTPDLYEYINNLLPRELACAAELKTDDGLPRLHGVGEQVNILAMMVGESLEPLLQLVCVLQPQKIILILNKKYAEETGKARKETMDDLIEALSGIKELGDFRPSVEQGNITGIILEHDTPTAVFRALDKAFRMVTKDEEESSEKEVNVVDITGAKKSMMVGAFLYAAHSGLPMTYVDFDSDKYNKTWRRPYGYACKIWEIANPYQAFALRDWERVRQLYHRYDFRGAQKVLTGEENSIMQVMSSHLDGQEHGPPLYDAEDIAKVQALSQCLNMYEAWDSGDFQEAYRIAKEMDLEDDETLPTAIHQFGSNWFRVTAEGIRGGPEHFYGDKYALRVYAVDELQRIKRLITFNQDYRSAFLRAGGLNEVVMTARLVAQFSKDEDRDKVLTILQISHTPKISSLFMVLSSDQTKPRKKLFDTGRLKGAGETALAEWVKQVPLPLHAMPAWWKQPSYSDADRVFAEDEGWKQFLEIRNSLTHRYVSVSEDLARDAVRFVQANIENFFEVSREDLPGVHTDSLPWRQLINLLQLDFLPPRLRDDISQEVIL